MKRSKHSLSHHKLLTCKMGQLVPVTWFETLPGDTIQQATSALIRCAPLVTPVMHPIDVRFHHWFVPNRLLWTNWQDFITGGSDGLNSSMHPFIQSNSLAGHSGNNAGVSTLGDYLGAMTSGASTDYYLNALPFRAYQLIWNNFYRDQDLQTAAAIAYTDGDDATTSTALQSVSWEKDYLTSARPWVLKGSAVTLPLGTSAPVKRTSNAGAWDVYNAGGNVKATTGSSVLIDGVTAGQLDAPAGQGVSLDPKSGNLYADLSAATSIDINTVRHAFALQRFEEARARYGSRYTEYLRYLGVRSSDARLQLPEYLGGGRSRIQFSEVLQTGGTSAGAQTGVGNMAGHGISAVRTNRYRRFFEEHGIVMTLMSVRPKTMYSQRLKRGFIRGILGSPLYGGLNGSKEDYWQRELQHIGQQGVNNAEVDAQNNSANVFGYQDRYDEYRREESSVAGAFRSALDTWHLSREFGGAASLNSTFVSCVPSTRVFADTSADNLYVLTNHSIQARRLVAREGTSSIA